MVPEKGEVVTQTAASETVAAGEPAPVTEDLAAYAAGLTYGELPSDVVTKAKLLIRDGLANQLGASTIAEPARVAHTLMSSLGGTEQATVTGYGTRLPLPHTAMLNAMLGHGIELDDAHGRALTKSGSVLVPSVMSTGEFLERSGADTIVAAVVGYDVMVRLGLAINPSHRQRGFHTTGAVGSIAAAGAATKQFQLDAEAIAGALGLGAMQSAGVQSYLDYPCMAKPLSPGKAAFNGILAAMLTDQGFVGPRHGLESQEGFFNAYTGEVDVDEIYAGLGSEFKVREVGFKPHAACRYAHGPIDAAQTIFGEHRIETAEIAKVVVRMGELAIRQSGRSDTPNLNAAMGSTPFGVALALTHGQNGLGDYKAGFDDPAVHGLSHRVELVAVPEYGLMGREAQVQLRLSDGTEFEQYVSGPKGEPENPVSDTDLENKFLGLAELAVGEWQAATLNDVVMNLELVQNISEVTRLLVRRDAQ